jgi:hypothetical protein
MTRAHLFERVAPDDVQPQPGQRDQFSFRLLNQAPERSITTVNSFHPVGFACVNDPGVQTGSVGTEVVMDHVYRLSALSSPWHETQSAPGVAMVGSELAQRIGHAVWLEADYTQVMHVMGAVTGLARSVPVSQAITPAAQHFARQHSMVGTLTVARTIVGRKTPLVTGLFIDVVADYDDPGYSLLVFSVSADAAHDRLLQLYDELRADFRRDLPVAHRELIAIDFDLG